MLIADRVESAESASTYLRRWHGGDRFTFNLPFSHAVSNPSVVYDSFTGSVTNGPVDNSGMNVTALGPPPGIPTDADGVTEMEVYTLSSDGGATWQNVGLDLGPSQFVP